MFDYKLVFLSKHSLILKLMKISLSILIKTISMNMVLCKPFILLIRNKIHFLLVLNKILISWFLNIRFLNWLLNYGMTFREIILFLSRFVVNKRLILIRNLNLFSFFCSDDFVNKTFCFLRDTTFCQ